VAKHGVATSSVSRAASEAASTDNGSSAATCSARDVGHASDPANFERFYEEHFAFVWRMLKGFGVASGSIDDATQDVFITAHRRLAEFRAESSVRTWLGSIAYHVALNYRRSYRRKGGHEPLDVEHPSTHAGPDRSLENQHILTAVGRFLEPLDEGKRAVFLLTFVEGLTAPEVAAALGIPMNTIYSRLHQVRTAFRNYLAQQEAEP
jgi:RNA polymerase sigma-70 factor (ECF subfamily)